MGISGGPDIVQDNLVLDVDASDKNSYPGSGTTWRDLSGNSNNGTLTNGPTFNSGNGGSIVFDGVDDYGSTSSSTFQSGNNPFTMEVWFRWNGNGTNTNNMIFAYGWDIGGGNRCPLIMISSNLVRFEFGSSTGAVNSSTIQINTWYHALATYNLSSSQIYLNSVLQNTTSYSSANVVLNGSNGQTAGIGCLFSDFGNVGSGTNRRYGTFNGNIANIRYYNRALSSTEILQNYNATRTRFGL